MIVQKFAEDASEKQAPGWDDIRYFLELARQRTLTAAARQLGVEHSTVARRVSALERRLAVRLFDRLPKSWNLTAEGEALLAPAQRVEEEALAFQRAGSGMDALRGVVKISAPPVFASHFLVPHLAALRADWPGITIELTGEARQANLYRGEADLALRLSRPAEPGLAARPLAELGYGLYAAPAWLERAPEHWEFIGYDDSLRDTPQQEWLDEFAAARPFAFRSNDLAALYQACRAGMGVALLPHFLARSDHVLCPLADRPCPVVRPVWLVVHPDVRRSPRVKAMADALTGLLHAQAAVLR